MILGQVGLVGLPSRTLDMVLTSLRPSGSHTVHESGGVEEERTNELKEGRGE